MAIPGTAPTPKLFRFESGHSPSTPLEAASLGSFVFNAEALLRPTPRLVAEALEQVAPRVGFMLRPSEHLDKIKEADNPAKVYVKNRCESRVLSTLTAPFTAIFNTLDPSAQIPTHVTYSSWEAILALSKFQVTVGDRHFAKSPGILMNYQVEAGIIAGIPPYFPRGIKNPTQEKARYLTLYLPAQKEADWHLWNDPAWTELNLAAKK